jgi:hypothetical protein
MSRQSPKVVTISKLEATQSVDNSASDQETGRQAREGPGTLCNFADEGDHP